MNGLSDDDAPTGYVGRRRLDEETWQQLVLAEVARLLGDNDAFLAQRQAARERLRRQGLGSAAAMYVMDRAHFSVRADADQLLVDLGCWFGSLGEVAEPVWMCADVEEHALFERTAAQEMRVPSPYEDDPNRCDWCGGWILGGA